MLSLREYCPTDQKIVSHVCFLSLYNSPKHPQQEEMLYNHDNYTYSKLFIKRIVDVILAMLFLVMSAPAAIIFTLWMCLVHHKRPLYHVLYNGRGGRPFSSYLLCPCPSATTEESKDTFIERVRHILTRIPLLVNVVRGDISLTGTYLYLHDELTSLKSHYPDTVILLQSKPGLISPSKVYAQTAPSAVDIRRQIEIDIRYIKSRTFTVDIQMFADYISENWVNISL